MQNLSDKWIYIVIGIVSIIIVGVAVMSLSGEQKTIEASKEVLVKENSQVLGSKDAKVVIVEFSDFQCPACRAAHPIVKQVIKEYGDKVLFVYRHFPLVASHQYALKAAEASEAAGEQGKFWEYHDTLFANQENLKEDDLKNYAKELGLDMAKFEEALNSGKFKEKVTSDMDDGEGLGVRSTPTFFINNTMQKGVINIDKFRELIDAELAK